MVYVRSLLCCCLLTSTAAAQSVFPVRDSGEAPDKTYDVLHYAINVTIDDRQKNVDGWVTTTLIPYRPDTRVIEFDAEEMDIHRVLLRKRALPFEVHSKTVAITLDHPCSFTDTLTVTVEYSCHPKRGLYFVQPDSANPDKPWQIWTQGEDMDNHFWFPCHDFPNDKATTEVTATVDAKYTVLSNGELLSVSEDTGRKTKTFHWRENKPHVSYLVMLAIGQYTILHDRVGDLPLEYYVYPGNVEDAKVCFSKTPDMIRFFERKIGFPYPWEKYAQVLIKDFIEGGMENTSATSLADEATVYDARTRIDRSPTSLIAHELAHQWWGDVVTCKDWRHLWLNESFASYFDPLYHEYLLGRDEFDFRMYNAQQEGIRTDQRLGRKPIVSVGSYTQNVYPRGASVLHMLRFILGDQLFWRAMHHYITKYQFQSVETNDLKVALEEATGENLYWFFDEWVYRAGHPVFDVSYSWNDTSRSVEMHVRQTQTMDSLTGVFRTPVDIELTTPGGTVTHRAFLNTQDTTLTLPAPAKPTLVLFDKGNWILKELHFKKSDQEWMVQATEAKNPVDRLRAVDVLLEKADSVSSLPLLARIATQDTFWGVRREAVEALGKLSAGETPMRDTARLALIAAARDERSVIRAAAATGLSSFHSPDVVATLMAELKDSSYAVVAAAVRALAKADSADALPVAIEHLSMPSHGAVIAMAALSSLEDLDSSRAFTAAMDLVRNGEPTGLRFTAMRILREGARKDPKVLSLFTTLASDKNSFIQMSALRTLGEFGDEAVLPLLDRLASSGPERTARVARESARKIRDRLKSP